MDNNIEQLQKYAEIFEKLSGNVTIKTPVSDELGIPLNDNGSIPLSALHVHTEKLRHVVQILSNIGQNAEELDVLIHEAVWSKLADDVDTLVPRTGHYAPIIDALEKYSGFSEIDSPEIHDLYTALFENTNDWLDITIEFEAVGLDDDPDAVHMITIESVTPGFRAFREVMQYATTPEALEVAVWQLIEAHEDGAEA